MNTSHTNHLLFKDQQLIFENKRGTQIPLPNLTRLVELYHEHHDTLLQERIAMILQRDLGSLLIVETMMDMSHEVTLNRLETGEISKTMKHVNDYYVILDSEYELAKSLFEHHVHAGTLKGVFEDCHFAQFPFGLVIKRDAFPQYQTQDADISILNKLITK